MSEEFEDISVDVSIGVSVDVAPVGGGTEAPIVAVDSSEPVSEQPDADQRVFDNSPKIGSSEDNIRQDVAAENGTALGNGGDEGRAPVTERGKEEAENKKQDARSFLIDQMERADALRKEKEDNFGMSSRDLTKLLDFISNPEMQEKLKARLTKTMGEKRADKAMAELNEFSQLKKKQDEGKELTDVEKARMAELRKSEDLKSAIQQTQDMRNEMELKTNGAKVAVAAAKIESAEVGTQATARRENAFSSFATSEISADSISNKYNVAAANKNEPIAPEIVVTQANVMKNKTVEVAGAGFTV